MLEILIHRGVLCFAKDGVSLFLFYFLHSSFSVAAADNLRRRTIAGFRLQVVATPEAQADFQDAMKFWEEKAGQTLFDYRGIWNSSSSPYTGTPDNPGSITNNVIFFQNPWPAPINVIGQTVVTANDSAIQHAMIMINPNGNFCTGDCIGQDGMNSERKNFAHELGHFLGLTHVQDISNVMYPVIQPGASLTDVTIDQATFNELVMPL